MWKQLEGCVGQLAAHARVQLKSLIKLKGLCALGILGGFTVPQQTGLMANPPGNMTCSLSPLQYHCLYFSRHICYCLILKKKVAERRIMKSKPNTHS